MPNAGTCSADTTSQRGHPRWRKRSRRRPTGQTGERSCVRLPAYVSRPFRDVANPAFRARIGAWALGVFMALAIGRVSVAQEIASLAQFYQLSLEQAAKGLPFRFAGTVVCYDLEWGQFYVFNEPETAYFDPHLFGTEFNPGQYVEVAGKTTVREGRLALTNLQAAVFGQRPLPRAKAIPLAGLRKHEGEWNEIQGRVRVVETSLGRLGLVLHSRGQSCLVYVMGQVETNSVRRLAGDFVRVRGVNTSSLTRERNLAQLMAPGINALAILKPADTNLFAVPVSSIDFVLGLGSASDTDPPVHINGLVSGYEPGSHLSGQGPDWDHTRGGRAGRSRPGR